MEKLSQFVFHLLGTSSASQLPVEPDAQGDLQPDSVAISVEAEDVPSLKEVQKELELGLSQQSIHVQTRIVDLDAIFHNPTSSFLRRTCRDPPPTALTDPPPTAHETKPGNDTNPEPPKGEKDQPPVKSAQVPQPDVPQADVPHSACENNVGGKKNICFQKSMIVGTMVFVLIWDLLTKDGSGPAP